MNSTVAAYASVLLLACARPTPREERPDERFFQAAELARSPSAEVRALLDSPSAAVRSRAALAVGRIADPQAVPKLALLARDDETAAWALGRIDLGRDALVACLPRPACARALGGNIQAIDALIDALPEPEAAFALGVTARNKDAKFPARAWSALSEALPRIPAAAAYALSRMPKGERVHGLEIALRDSEPWTRALAARAWGVQGLPASGLEKAFDDPDWRVRVEAARGLATAPGAADSFKKVLPAQTSEHVRNALFEAAAQIGPSVLDAVPTTPCIAALARDRIRKRLVDTPDCAPRSDWRQRARIGALAAELGLETEAAAAMRDPDGRVRGAAAGAAVPALAPEVRKLLEDPDPYVVAEAAGVLANDAGSREAAKAAARRLDKAREKPAGDPEYDALASLTPLTGSMLPKRPFAVPAEARAMPRARTLRIRTSKGDLVIDLDPDVAPLTSSALAVLATRKFYDGLTFHRVVPDFVVQGGDPRGDGDGGPGWSLPDEHSPLRFLRGTLGIATNGPETGGSQFFLCHSPQPHLDGKYTVAGKLRKGDDVLDALQVGDTIDLATAE
ncbi:MAG: peptidylprolyl isomerase [Myxococcales bacterium]|nr:peptidylprolyl isomerase [Myxococcales bacterium]